jgi:type I restriction enzyme S subunit
VQVSLKRYRSAVLKAACEGRLVPTEAELARKESRSYEPADKLLERILTERRAKWNGRGKYETPSAPDTGKLPELPEGWCWATVEQVADVQSGNTPSGIENLVSADGDIPWFKVGSMNMPGNEHHLALSDARLTAKSAAKLSLRIIPKGAFVFPKRGGAIATNKKRILAQDSCCDLNMMAIIPASTVAGYLWWWLVSLDLGRLSDGSNVPQINHKDIDPLPFPLPPLAEQQRIVAEVERRLSVVDELAAMVAANLKRADRLRQAILKRAFEGKLVPQDPKEEPAEKLLERISKERKSQSRKTRIR